jgi:triacylglycerol lipase
MHLVAFIAGVLSHLEGPPVPPQPGRPPVVLVHGIFSCGKDMRRLASHLRAEGWEVFVPSLTPNNGATRLEDLAHQLSDYTRRELGGRQFDLVGFSMGGLVSRYYLQRIAGPESVRRFITMASPHNGTHMARLRNAPGCVQMRPDSEFLRDLARDADSLRRVGFTSFYTPLDTIIVPPRSSEMPQARNVRMWGLIHPSFVLEGRCVRAVAQALRAP